MFPCPKKCTQKTRVLETRQTKRRYECVLCGFRWSTIEVNVDAVPPPPPPIPKTSRKTTKPRPTAKPQVAIPLPKTRADLPSYNAARAARHLIEDLAAERELDPFFS